MDLSLGWKIKQKLYKEIILLLIYPFDHQLPPTYILLIEIKNVQCINFFKILNTSIKTISVLILTKINPVLVLFIIIISLIKKMNSKVINFKLYKHFAQFKLLKVFSSKSKDYQVKLINFYLKHLLLIVLQELIFNNNYFNNKKKKLI